MKILMLNYEYPPLGGGAGVCTKYESEGLAKLGHQVTVVTTWFKGEKEIEKKGNLTVIRLKSKRKYEFKSNPFEMLSYVLHAKKFLSEYCKDNLFDICIANFTMVGGSVALFLKKKFNIPYVVISHGHDIPWFLPKQMFFYHCLTYFSIKKICKNAERVILLTSEMKANADRFLRKEAYKDVVIPNGCDIEKFKPRFSNKSKKFKIIFVGRLRDQKDPMTFLKSIRLVLRERNDFEVEVLGDGPLRNKMELFVKSNNLPVIFLGWVSKEIMLRGYQSANLQVVTSLQEAMSIATLESLCCGQTIFSTPVSGNTDLLPKENFFNFKDNKRLSEMIIKEIGSPKEMNKKRIDQIRKEFNWSNIVKKYDRLLKEVIG